LIDLNNKFKLRHFTTTLEIPFR